MKLKKLLEENEGEDITRSAVKIFREYLDEKDSAKRDPDTIDAFNGRSDSEAEEAASFNDDADVTDKSRKAQDKEADPEENLKRPS